MNFVENRIEVLKDDLEIIDEQITDLLNNGCDNTYVYSVAQFNASWIKFKIAMWSMFTF